jgi:hypothetical protein
MDEVDMNPHRPASVDEELLDHARRQTKALESIHGVLMFFLALSILGVLIAAAATFRS